MLVAVPLMIIIISSQGGTGQCFSRTDVKIEYKERILKPPCLEHAQAALTRETYRSKFYSLLYHEEEFHSSILANRYHLSNTLRLRLYVDQQSTIYHYCSNVVQSSLYHITEPSSILIWWPDIFSVMKSLGCSPLQVWWWVSSDYLWERVYSRLGRQ